MKPPTLSSWCRTLSSDTSTEPAAKERISGQFGCTAPLRIREILVPTDFSEHANVALEYAIRFAERLGASLTLLQVVAPPVQSPEANTAFPSAELLNQLSLAAMEDLARFCEQEGLKFPVASQAVVRVGEPCALIEETAAELHVDLIILGTHGRTGLAHVLLGSLAERVMRGAPCPVLVVQAQHPVPSFN